MHPFIENPIKGVDNLKEYLTIDEISIFLEVVNAGSITGASKNLFMSQPTISQHIKNMEEKLSFKLFERSKSKGLTLTEKGLKAYKSLKKFSKTLDETMEELTFINESVESPLRIGATKVIGDYLFPEIIVDFFKVNGYTNLCIEIQNTEETIKKVLDEDVSFGLIETPFCHKTIDTQKFFADELKLICHPSSEFASRDSVSLDDLKDVPLIFREIGSGTRKLIEEEFSKNDFSPKIHLSFSSNEAIKIAVMNNLGFAIFSEIAVKREKKMGLLCVVKIEDVNFKRNFYISKKHGKYLSDEENKLIEFLKNLANGNSIQHL